MSASSSEIVRASSASMRDKFPASTGVPSQFEASMHGAPVRAANAVRRRGAVRTVHAVCTYWPVSGKGLFR